MFNNWKTYGNDPQPIETGLSFEQAQELVDKSAGTLYAVDPNGNTYPPDLHDDGDYDPVFN
jgi:hypothetical protein